MEMVVGSTLELSTKSVLHWANTDYKYWFKTVCAFQHTCIRNGKILTCLPPP